MNYIFLCCFGGEYFSVCTLKFHLSMQCKIVNEGTSDGNRAVDVKGTSRIGRDGTATV
jgi:hypothetical protein